jgi:3-hydroxyacyl-CoA dehydrogenase
MSDLVKLTRLNDIAIITIHNPPVNALSPGVPEGILHSIAAAAEDPAVKAIVVIGAGSTFHCRRAAGCDGEVTARWSGAREF